MSDAYPEYIEEFNIEIADYNPIEPTAYMALPETMSKRNNVSTLEKSIKAFSNHKCIQPNPYWIIWDLECLTAKLTPEENAQLIWTEKIQRHKPCGYSYVVIRMDSFGNYEITSYDLYKGPNVLEKFVDKLEEELAEIQADLSSPVEIIMEPGDHITFNKATECYICKKPFIEPAPEILQQFEKAKQQLLKCPEEIPEIQSIALDVKIGYMLKVDIETPINLHNFFTDYPLVPKKQIVPENWLSLYNERLVHNKAVGGGKYVMEEKLLQTLLLKKNYIVHYRAL
ncbi:13456_t:CDS:2 [Acaulospora morrowiae]|uniref:13456_t:CDS:1 n=1 Tax=Acaulospora morrowiae TaxID=94023 RepID=A0A9N9DF95_9GLOM|nr:13456_t:CDS:2 [Acaulospora morrowiae]